MRKHLCGTVPLSPIVELICRMRSSICRPTEAAHHLQIPWSSGRLMLGPICISKALATGALGGIADGPDGLDIHVTPLDVVHTASANPAERSPTRYRFVPVLPDTGVGDGSAEQLR